MGCDDTIVDFATDTVKTVTEPITGREAKKQQKKAYERQEQLQREAMEQQARIEGEKLALDRQMAERARRAAIPTTTEELSTMRRGARGRGRPKTTGYGQTILSGGESDNKKTLLG